MSSQNFPEASSISFWISNLTCMHPSCPRVGLRSTPPLRSCLLRLFLGESATVRLWCPLMQKGQVAWVGTLGINGYQGLLPERAMKENKTTEKNLIRQLFKICSTNEVQTDCAEEGEDSAENITRNSLTNAETCFLIHTTSVCPRVPMETQQSRKLADVVFHVPAYFSPKVWLLTRSSFSCNRLV